MSKPKAHNFRLVHRYGVSSTPRVIMDYSTGKISSIDHQGKAHVVEAHGHTFHILRSHLEKRNVPLVPYTGRFPKLALHAKRFGDFLVRKLGS